MWIYEQTTGDMQHDINGARTYLATGYSGRGADQNDPDKQCEEDFGPLPRGTYSFGSPVVFNNMDDCLRLIPDPNNDMCGRSGFFIHDGVFSRPDGDTSHGCICLLHAARLTMWG